MRLSEEQIERASTVNLPQFLMQNGFDLKRVGREYIWKDHDSVNIKDTRHAVACCLLADLAGAITAFALAPVFFG